MTRSRTPRELRERMERRRQTAPTRRSAGHALEPRSNAPKRTARSRTPRYEAALPPRRARRMGDVGTHCGPSAALAVAEFGDPPGPFPDRQSPARRLKRRSLATSSARSPTWPRVSDSTRRASLHGDPAGCASNGPATTWRKTCAAVGNELMTRELVTADFASLEDPPLA